MKLILTLFLTFFLFFAKSQTPNLQWVKTFGSSANDYCNSIAIDHFGNTISIGYFGNTIDFDPGLSVYNLTSNGHFDIFLLKLDVNGNFLWAKSIGGNRADIPVALKLDSIGNILIAGGFGGTVDFDPGSGTYNMSTIDPSAAESFILKLDSNANFLWAKQFSSNISLLDFDLDNSSNLYATGSFVATADFDPGPSTYNLTEFSNSGPFTGKNDAFIFKLNSIGNFLWAKQLGGTDYDQANSISIDKKGNILTTGYFSGTGDFDPNIGFSGLTTKGGIDVFISKLDNDGNFIWIKQIGSNNEDRGFDIITDSIENVYIVGNFSDTADFNTDIGIYNLTPKGFDGFVLKISSTGQFQWAKQVGGLFNATDICKAISIDQFGNMYITGSFEKTCDFDTGLGIYNLTSKGYQDIFVLKIDNLGNFLWATAMGSVDNSDYGLDIKVDKFRKIYIVGFFWGTVDFDPSLAIHNVSMVGTGDCFILKLSQCNNITYSSINAHACNNYTLNNTLYTRSGNYIQTISNSKNCDSVITLNLTIGNSITNFSANSCDNYFWRGKTISNSGIYDDSLYSIKGCDSIIRLNLTIKKKSFSNINASICTGQTFLGYNLSGTYIDTFVANNGCDSIRTLNLLVNPIKTISFNPVICEGNNYSGYSKSGIYVDTFKSFNGCDSIRIINLTVLPKNYTIETITICQGKSYFGYTKTGTYIDTFIANNGCDSIRKLILNVIPIKILNIAKTICKGQSYLGHTVNGLYNDTIRVANGCDSVINLQLIVDDKPILNLLKDTTMCEGSSFYIDVGSYPSIIWQDSTKTQKYLISKAGYYTVKVTNHCGTTNAKIIINDSLCNIVIPNAFSPNGDGINDQLEIRGLERFPLCHLNIFSRSGLKVFESFGYFKKWDGTYYGKPLPIGVYYYILTIQNSEQKRSGSITILK